MSQDTTRGIAGETTPAPGAITQRVREMYMHHPFPPLQRKHTYARHAAYVRAFLQQRGIEPERKRFGDIACGTGMILLDYAKEFPDTQIVGYDLSAASVERANRALAEEGATNGSAEVRDIMALEVEEEFDYILSWGTIHHLNDPEKGIGVLSRALRPGGILRTGIYGFYGNWERRVQQEIIRMVAEGSDMEFEDQIELVREWAGADRNFKNYYTAPPVDLGDDDWVVDEFLHVWEQHLRLGNVISWLQASGLEILHMTDYYDQEISLDIAQHSTSGPFVERVQKLPFVTRCQIIEMIVRPYWLSVFAQKPASSPAQP